MSDNSNAAHSRIELKISCENLPRPSSNQVIMFVKDSQTKQWVPTSHRTEVIDSSNPEFINSMIVDYRFEELQPLRFICVDARGEIGHYECTLGSLLSSESRKRKEKLTSDSNDESHDAHIIISVEKFEDSKDIVTLQIKLHDIVVDEQAFLVLSRTNEDGTYSPVHKTQNTNSSMLKIEVGENILCGCDRDREFKIEVKDDDDGVHGECSVTLDDLLEDDSIQFPLNSEGSKLEIKASLKKKSTFLDYIASGTRINLVVAIDFTESNGNPKDPTSLHYIEDKNKENDYQQAIRGVGEILEQYDSDKNIPVYGFGAKFNGKISHAYPLNNDFKKPEVHGINDVMKVYQETIDSVELYGPTNFSPVIKQTTRMIKSEIETNRDAYYILLIVTDGIISDMDTTIRSIVKTRELPLSIIIVGVGDADFTKMEVLDADDKPLKMQLNSQLPGEIKGRDIVQFIAMREFKSEEGSAELLAKTVMEEIPNQFMGYKEYMECDI